MILTCPECATGYFVEDGQIRPGGRTVRCAACGARWKALPEGPLELVSSDADGALAKAPAAAAPAADGVTALSGEDLPRAFRDRAEEERRMRRAAMIGAAWASGAVVVALAVVLAIVFRESVVGAWPQTASVYAAIGLPVNATGLAIEQIHAEPSLDQGHATLEVSGVIRNVVDHPVTAPPMRISLVNAQGKRVAGQIANLDNARIPPGETRHFLTSLVDPPYSAADLEVTFVLGARPPTQMIPVRPAIAPPPTTPGFTLRGTPGNAAPANAAAAATNTAPASVVQ
jgi:predicted Zn finger-like uncharacterized protein